MKVTSCAGKNGENMINITPSLNVHTVADIFQFPDLEFLVGGLMHKNTVVLISGDPKIGKSTFVLQLCKALCSGQKFLGSYQCLESRVLIIDEENGQSTLKKRFQSLGFHKSEKNLVVQCSMGFRIDNDEWFRQLSKFIQDEKINVVVFDSFVRIHSKEENSASEMKEVSQKLRTLANSGVTVIVIHHSGKSHEKGPKNPFRGSQEIIAGVDSAFSLKKRGEQICFESTIQRDLPGDISIILKKEITPAGGIHFEQVSITKALQKSKKEIAIEAIIEVMENHFKQSIDLLKVEDILSAVKMKLPIGEKNVKTALRELKEAGKVTFRSEGHNRRLYGLPAGT